MDTREKVEILGAAAKYDICASSCSPTQKQTGSFGSRSSSGICHSYTPDGRCVSLFKVLMTNACKNNCKYCVNRVSNDFERTSFSPDELAYIFIELYKRNYVEGIFLSSGVKQNTVKTMQEMLDTLEILRFKYHYGGYVHLKILPRTPANLIEQGACLADRLSINLESPNPDKLQRIANDKDFMLDLLDPMTVIQQQIKKGLIKSGHTTQFVVGAGEETDSELLKTTNWLYKHKDLRRAYFSAFVPVNSDIPLLTGEIDQTFEMPRVPTPLLREHRLYQSDWLLRIYKFNLEDIVFRESGNLILEVDPKMAYALKHPEKYPIEINTAPYEDLLKIPGLGITSARRIYRVRKEYHFQDQDELKNVGVVTKRALPFMTINGKRLGKLKNLIHTEQLELFRSYLPA